MRTLENSTFTIAILNDSLFILDELQDGTLVGRSGLHYQILECLALLLGFSYKLVLPKDGQYGLLSPNGTWNGAVRMLMEDEVDFTALSLIVTPEREKAINFSLTCKHENIAHITKADSSTCGNRRRFLAQPLQNQVWILMYAGVTTFLLVQLIINKCFPKYYKFIATFSIWNIVSLTFGLVVSKRLPVLNAPGITVLAMVIFIACVMKIYGSTLSSTVNVKKCDKSIDELNELVKAVRLKTISLGIIKTHGIFHACLKNSKVPELQELGLHLDGRGSEREKTFPDAFHSIKNSNYALIMDVEAFIMLMAEHEFSLREVHISKQPLFKINTAMAYGQSFKYQKLFNQAMGRLRSYGLFQKFEAVQLYNLEKDMAISKENQRNNVVFIGMADLEYIAVLFCLTLCTSSFLIILENYYFTIEKNCNFRI